MAPSYNPAQLHEEELQRFMQSVDQDPERFDRFIEMIRAVMDRDADRKQRQADKVNEKKQDPADSVSTAAFSAAEHSEDCSPALRVAHPVTRQQHKDSWHARVTASWSASEAQRHWQPLSLYNPRSNDMM
eukprot:CAMPEP_0181434758 /NCGR_PEP_ID=MMETSP1110-20121109/19981_1 /TAXON_ID=174948 /ORGANISM="Symbiodinium sp., Strain CCMP421" /LENGTH=129 /DNA_ID=CAMNT_0023558269 /DNA_START=27 /DNA_END=417 /DNA_ORIENTATION=-